MFEKDSSIELCWACSSLAALPGCGFAGLICIPNTGPICLISIVTLLRTKLWSILRDPSFLQASHALSYNPTDRQYFRTKRQALESCLRIQGKTEPPDSTHNSQLISVTSNS